MFSQEKIRIAVTGPESTGKTTLAMQLADVFQGQYIAEYAREYVEKLSYRYAYEDVEAIARMQVSQYYETRVTPQKLYFFDTWLIITKVWFKWVFDKSPEWLDVEIRNCPIDLFILCKPDLPWEADLVRENGGKKRNLLFGEYRKELEYYGFSFVEIGGNDKIRLENAIIEINNKCGLK